MITAKSLPNRHHRLQSSYLKALAQVGPFVEGSLCAFRRAGRRSSSWHLTYKVKGKTHTVYVPVGMVEEVRQWTREYRRLKQLIRKETKQSLAIIHQHGGGGQRAASRSRASTRS
jgi:hypothetical protein